MRGGRGEPRTEASVASSAGRMSFPPSTLSLGVKRRGGPRNEHLLGANAVGLVLGGHAVEGDGELVRVRHRPDDPSELRDHSRRTEDETGIGWGWGRKPADVAVELELFAAPDLGVREVAELGEDLLVLGVLREEPQSQFPISGIE